MFRLAIEKALNHMINVNEINITRLDNSLVSVYVDDIDLRPVSYTHLRAHET